MSNKIVGSLDRFFLKRAGDPEKTSHEIEHRFSIVLMISVVFLTLLGYLYNLAGSVNEDLNKNLLNAGIYFLIYLIAYGGFQLFKNKLGDQLLSVIDLLMLVGILAFIIPVGFLVSIKNNVIRFVQILTLKAAFIILGVVPALIILLLLIWFIWRSIRG